MSLGNKNDYAFKRSQTRVRMITPDNIQDIYRRYFNQFLYLRSDNVEVNGKVVNDPMKRQLLLLRDYNGEPNIKTASADGLIGGFPLTEVDFIDKELSYITTEGITELKLRKQTEAYLDFLHKRKKEIEKVESAKSDLREFKDSPFTSPVHFEAFQYLNDHYNDKTKVRWTYIYNFLSERLKIGVSQSAYFGYICQHIEPVAKRRNENANDPKRIEVLNELFTAFSKKELCDL